MGKYFFPYLQQQRNSDSSALSTHRSAVEVVIVILRDSSYLGPCLHDRPGHGDKLALGLCTAWKGMWFYSRDGGTFWQKEARLARTAILGSDNLRMSVSRSQCKEQGRK